METDMEMIRLYRPPPTLHCHSGRCEDMLMTILFCVVIPVVVVLILLIFLTVIMCCSRKSCKCKKYSSLMTETNDIQLETYNTIQRATASLRHMSHNRETPMVGSGEGSSMTLDRSYRQTRRPKDSCHSAPGTLQRQHRNRYSGVGDQPTPPPPPAYSMHSSDIFFGSEFLSGGGDMQASVQYEDSPEHNGNRAQPLLYQHHYQ